ncbi:hypothetical protein AMTRI_Chr01g134290 [Amborella trichopoda]
MAKLCLPKSQGGLAIRNLRNHNIALLDKWWWRHATHTSPLWREVIKHKYCQGNDNWVRICRSSDNISCFWKSILRCRDPFLGHIRSCPREGTRVQFWNDTWVSSRPLRDQFPNLFRIARDTTSTVEENFGHAGHLRT